MSFSPVLSAKEVQAAEQHHVETPLVGIEKELLGLEPLSRTATFLVAVLSVDRIAQALGKGTQFKELVVVGLAFVTSRDTGIDAGN